MSEVATIPETETIPQVLTPMQMLEKAVNNNAATETLERLMALEERWRANEARRAFDNAMSDLRADLPEIIKSSEVDYTHNGKRTHYKYEDLSAVTKALSPVMAKCGLSFRWRTKQENGGVIVTCVISHRNGHYEETSLQAQPDNSAGKNSIQSIGSTVTYLQRYTLKAAVGVAASYDDDGQTAGFDAPPQTEQSAPQQRSNTLPKAGARDLYEELQQDVDSAENEDALRTWATSRRADIDSLPTDWRQNLRDRYAEKMVDLQHGEAVYEYQEEHNHGR